ncbi:response regulator [Kribbella catacumbae]|uniref:response regulator n=1 Tax=Kribbella catacumbae TaxID=460086 RepID=UPI000381F263|nr:response regulator [Kribbella catacumbae]
MCAQVVLAEDDEKQAELVRRYLERENHSVIVVHDWRSALEEVRRRQPELLVLDVILPGVDGLDVCRILRQESDIPVLMLTARTEEDDMLLGLDLGADDYMTKPFSPRELAARVRTLLRRTRVSAVAEPDTLLRVGGVSVDTGRHDLFADGNKITCTPGEFRLIATMAARPHRVFTRAQLLEQLHGIDQYITTRTIDTHVLNLRKKIEPDPRKPVRLAARSTTVAIQEQQGQALADDAKIYNTLIGYAATHRGWSGIGKEISRLSLDIGRQITLTSRKRELISGEPVQPSQNQSAIVDPLDLSAGPLAGTGGDQIDPRVVGPFRLAAAQRVRYDGMAKRVLSCVLEQTGQGKIVTAPTGRPQVTGAPQYYLDLCDAAALDEIEPPQLTAYEHLQKLVNSCLAAGGPIVPIQLQANLSWSVGRGATPTQVTTPGPSEPKAGPTRQLPDPAAVERCLASSRRTQLGPYVAPPALLFVSTHSKASAELDLSPANQKRIAGVAAAILGITVLIAAVGGIRLVQPLRALTKASRQMTGGDENVRVKVRGTDEIGQLSLAFNDLADSRARTESLRRAMVSDIAHELRTPLSNIRGWLEAVEDGVAQPDQAFIASLSEEAALLQHIIDDLRDLATADAGNCGSIPNGCTSDCCSTR